jgi:hypothetical protein
VTSGIAAQLWAEPWAIEASVKADCIEHRARIAQACRPMDECARASATAVAELVDLARNSTARRRRWPKWRPLLDRWRGTSIQQAFQSLHAAEVFLVDLLPDAEVDAAVPDVVAKARAVLDRDDPRLAEVEKLPVLPPGPVKRIALQSAMRLTYEAADQMYVRVRDFRNVLLTSAALIAILMSALVGVVALAPTAVPLCFRPSAVTRTDSPAPAPLVCPSGEGRRAPARGDAALVAGLGLLGGAIAAAFAVRNIRGTSTPYDIPMALALLKVPSGALTAVTGLLLLRGNFIPGLSQLDSQPQILAYAILLGYAQQIGTRLIDSQAQTILGGIPSKDPDAKSPPPATPPAAPPPTAAPRTTPEG